MSRRIHRFRPIQSEKGFTLVEALIAGAIFAMVLLGLYVVYETNQSTYVRGEARADVQQNSRVALDQMTRELLMAGYDPDHVLAKPGTGISSFVMQNLGATSVKFVADVTGDGTTEIIEFSYDSTNKCIRRQVWETVLNGSTGNWDLDSTGGAQPITENDTITSLSFTYRDELNAVTANDFEVRRIEVALSATVKAGSQGTQTFTLASDVRPRNL